MKNNIGKIFLRRDTLPLGGCVLYYETRAIAIGDIITGVADFRNGTCQIVKINGKGVFASGMVGSSDSDIVLRIGSVDNWDPQKNMPTLRALEEELFVVRETVVIQHGYDQRIHETPIVTPKGQVYLFNKSLNETSTT